MWNWLKSLFKRRKAGAANHPSLPIEQALIGEWHGTSPNPFPLRGAPRITTRLTLRADSTFTLQVMMFQCVANDVGTWRILTGGLLLSTEDTHWDFLAGSTPETAAKFEELKASMLDEIRNSAKPEKVLWFGPDHIHIFDGDRVFFDLKRTKT